MNKNKVTIADGTLKIERVFNASRELVWKAWTDPKSMMKWWGPIPFTAPVIKMDLKVGGKYLYCMRSPEGKDYWSTGTYKEIVPMEKLVCEDSFANEKGEIVSSDYYGMSGMPMSTLVTMTLEDADGGTKMTVTHVGLPAGQISEMTASGWGTSFDKLEDSVS